MDLFNSLNISASGLAAQRKRMDVITENLANADSTSGPNGQVYRRKLVMLQAVDDGDFPTVLRSTETPDGAVRVTGVVESQAALRRVYEPGHPQAGPDGFVTMPNVNPLTEMIDMVTTSRAYEANVTAFQATKTMGQKLLELLR